MRRTTKGRPMLKTNKSKKIVRKNTSPVKLLPAGEKVYLLRTSNKDNLAHNNFLWPSTGFVEAPDWRPTAECGNGLHGLLGGLGDPTLLSSAPDALWTVFEALASEVIAI